jgi:hypothetical protein
MYGRSSTGNDDDDDNRKPSAKPLDSYRKHAHLPEAKDDTVKEDPSSDECESTSNRKRLAESDDGEDPKKEPLETGIDLTTVAGQRTLNPGMSEEDAREAAKKEYHRKHAARSRIRHKGLLRDLTDKVAELRKSNQELRETHDQLVSQLRLYESVEPGLVAQLPSLTSELSSAALPGGPQSTSLELQPETSIQASSVAPSLSHLLHGGGPHFHSHQGYMQARSQLAGLQSLLQSQSLLSPNTYQTQADSMSSIQQFLRQARDGSSIPPSLAPTAETDALTRLLSEALRGQSVLQQHAHLQASAALPMPTGNTSFHLGQLAQMTEAQRSLLGLNQGNFLGDRQAPLLQPTTVHVPHDEAARNQEVIELFLRYLASCRR